MTLDRTKKYKVGDVVCEYSPRLTNCWVCIMPTGNMYLSDTDLEALHPVEVEEPLRWSFEYDYVKSALSFSDTLLEAMPQKVAIGGNWRHEVVSTRIG